MQTSTSLHHAARLAWYSDVQSDTLTTMHTSFARHSQLHCQSYIAECGVLQGRYEPPFQQ